MPSENFKLLMSNTAVQAIVRELEDVEVLEDAAFRKRVGTVVELHEPDRIANINGVDVVVTDEMLRACIADIQSNVKRFELECKHTAAIASMLMSGEMFLDGPCLDAWNWKLSGLGNMLVIELKTREP